MARIWPSCSWRRATRSTAWCAAPAPRTSSASTICATRSSCIRPTLLDELSLIELMQKVTAGRDLQPGGDVVRAHLLDAAHAHQRVHGHRRRARAGSHAPRLPQGALLPGLEQRDVRTRPRDAPDRAHSLLPPQPLRRLAKVLRPPHHGELPRELRPLRRLGHPLQPREPPARQGVRHAEGHGRRGSHQARPAADKLSMGNLDAKRDWGFAGDYVERHVADAPGRRARRLRRRDRRHAHRARAVSRWPSRAWASTGRRT
jgi:hypothetical protein